MNPITYDNFLEDGHSTNFAIIKMDRIKIEKMFHLSTKNISGHKGEYFYKIPRVGVARPIFIKAKEVDNDSVVQMENRFQRRRRSSGQVGENERERDLRELVDRDIVGHDHGFLGPFGWKKYIYVDHTASGKALKSIEHFIQDKVLPHYANTHTTVSNTSLQTTIFRNEARNIIRQAVKATENDEVIFCGSGATSGVHKLLHSIYYPKSRKLIVFVGPFEHHSNILPWREAASKVIQVPANPETGHIDVKFLRDNLKKVTTKWFNTKNQLVVGCFSAGSNVTGAVTDDVEITELLHEFGALAFWDYAAAAPHVQVNMNPKCKNDHSTAAFKDAIFFSGHKFLGGPQTPGVLVVKKRVLQNPVPHAMGGGTVLFTTRRGHHYLDNLHEREEGGTPDIVGSIRLGLVFRLRNMVGIQNIIEMEAQLCRRMINEWTQLTEIHILGSNENPRLPCISFLIEHKESGYFLHHTFVVALLNDLFGIQCRGGCMCAGPYAQGLLGIDDNLASLYEECLKNENCSGSVLKPGFVRISLSYHSSAEEIEFVIQAVMLVAKYGWKLLPLYKIDKESGSFVFKDRFKPIVTSLALFDKRFQLSPSVPCGTTDTSRNFDAVEILKHAKHFMTSCYPSNSLSKMTRRDSNFKESFEKPKQLNKLRWFMLPSESLFLQYFPTSFIESPRPFTPLIIKPDDLMDSSDYIDTNNNSCPTVGKIGKVTVGNWRKGSVSDQIYRVWNKRRKSKAISENGKYMEIGTFYTSQVDETSDVSTASGYEEDGCS